MHIMFFSDHFKPEPSAPAAHVFERCKLWVGWGHQVTVMTSAPNFPEGKIYPGYQNHWRFIEDIDGIRVVRVKTFVAPNVGFLKRILDYNSFMISSLLLALFEPKPDVVISTSPHLFVAIGGAAYSKLRGVPHVFEVRDLWPASILATNAMKPGYICRILEHIELFLYHHSERILSLTQSYVNNLISRGVQAEKIDVVISGANLELFSPRPRNTHIEEKYKLKGHFVVGYLGTLGLAHGLENVVLAAELLKGKPIIFFFVGVGAAKPDLENMVRERDLTNVVFAPRQLKEDMPDFWSVCNASLIHLRNDDVFRTVIPSKIFESMAMGLPIIYAGPTGEGSNIVETHNAGWVVSSADHHALAEVVTLLAADPARCAELGANGLAAAPMYSRERQARDTLAVLEKAVRV